MGGIRSIGLSREGGVARSGPGCYAVVMPPPFERHVFICTNRRPDTAPRPSCSPRGSDAVRDAFKKQLALRGLHNRIRANASGCLDACEHGPSLVVYPDEVWYGGVTVEDVPELIEEHIIGGRPVERLRIRFDEPAPPSRLPPIVS